MPLLGYQCLPVSVRSLLQSNLFRSLFSSFFWRALGALCALLASISITRNLGADQAGLYFLAISILLSSMAVTSLGHPSLLLRHGGVLHNSHNGRLLGFVLKSIGLSALVALLLMVLVVLLPEQLEALLNKPRLSPVLMALLPAFLFVVILNQTAHALLGCQRTALAIGLQNVTVPAGLIVALLLIKTDSAVQAAHIYTILSMVAACVALAFVFKGLKSGPLDFQQGFAGWSSLLVMDSANMLVATGGVVIASAFLASAEVAQFGAANSLSAALGLILISVNLVVAPRFAKLYHQGEIARLKYLAQWATLISVLCALPVLVIMLLFSDTLMALFGDDFAQAGFVLLLLLVGQAVNACTGPVVFLLKMSGHERDLKNITLFTSLLALILHPLLASQLGLTGAALATSGTIVVNNLIAYALVVKRLGFHTFSLRPQEDHH